MGTLARITILLFTAFTILSCDTQNHNKDVNSSLRFSVDTLATGLEHPWGMEFLPDGRVLITERPGRLRVWENGELREQPVSGLPEIWAHGQGGLLDVVRHPDYEENGWLYFVYTAPGPDAGNTTIGRGRLQEDHLTDFEEIFQGHPLAPAGQHFGSRIVFDDQNYLFTTIGDRGDMDTAQEADNHNGTVIRLFDDGSIPPDNPFVDSPDTLPEIWTLGHRNIQGMIIHPETGDMWATEHGPKGGDELNIIFKGENYGWPLATFGLNYDGTIITPDSTLPGKIPPVTHWTPAIAPCGLGIVTSDKYPEWQGDLMIGSLVARHIHRVVIEGREVADTERLLEGFARFRLIQQGPDGYLYVVTEDPGLFFRLVPDE